MDSPSDEGNIEDKQPNSPLMEDIQQIHDAIVKLSEKFIITDNPKLDLITWCSMEWMDPPVEYTIYGPKVSDAWAYMILLGGAEHIATMISTIDLELFVENDPPKENNKEDNNEDNKEDLQKEDRLYRLVEQTLNLFINTGVVGALIMSILYEVALTPWPYSDDSIDFFGEDILLSFNITFMIFLYAALFFSIWVLFMTIHYYLILTIWLPTLELKLWYVTKADVVPMVVLISHCCIVASALCLPFGIAMYIGAEAGLIAVVMDIVMLAYIGFNLFSSRGGDAFLIKHQHINGKEMLIRLGMMKEDPEKLSGDL